jgi:hypothetical protein
MIFGGGILALFGICMWVFLGGYLGLIPVVFGMLGVLWLVVGILAIARRGQMAILI